MIKRLCVTATLTAALLHSPYSTATALSPQTLHTLGSRLCAVFAATPGDQLLAEAEHSARSLLGDATAFQSAPFEFRGRPVGVEVFITTPSPASASLSVQFITPPMRAPRTVVTLQRATTETTPELQLVYNEQCTTEQAWQQFFTADHRVRYQQRLAPDTWLPVGERQWLNPPLPALAPIQPARIRVGMIDSGVNYQLPLIANALARDQHGALIGYDFWDMDPLPFDAHPAQSPFVIQRHGTRTASIVIEEAPGIALVPYRYPRPDMSRMQALVAHAAGHQVRIIGMPLGGNRHQEWAEFQRAAESHPEILFIASAGNNGRDIDRRGVYPASLEIDNMLVVTSANDFVEPADRTNYGRLSVDYLLPAERISALDYNGTRREVSGSSYAVSRLVALAARLLNHTPSLTTGALKEAIEQLSIRANTSRYVSTGYLGDLYAYRAQVSTRALPVEQAPATDAKHTLPLDMFILSDQWQVPAISAALQEANDIFSQCDLQITPNNWFAVDAPAYLHDLATGHALTLRNQLPAFQLGVFFIDDTRMQPGFDAEAFGVGNTRHRPWLKNTLWITAATGDIGVALAHELFHIMTNNGRHSTDKNNLMNDRTASTNTTLTQLQCEAAFAFAKDAGLIRSQ